MENNYKKKSIFSRLTDKFQRRNRGNFNMIIISYFYYFFSKFKKFTNDKRAHILLQLNKNSIIAEVGVWKGDFSKKIYDFTSPEKLILVDPWIFDPNVRGCAPQVDGNEPFNQKFFDDAKSSTYAKFHNLENVEIIDKGSSDASVLYKNNFFDYIYIDGEHSYDAVLNDLNHWYPKLKKNGKIFGDDFYWREEDNSFSVKKAYEDFILNNKIKKWCVFKSQICLIK